MGPQDASSSGARLGGISASEMGSAAKSPARDAPKWEPRELEIVRRGDLTVIQMAELLPGRSESAILTRRSMVGINARGKRKPVWSEDEIRILVENSDVPAKDLTAKLPGRTAVAIRVRRCKGLHEVRRPQWRITDVKRVQSSAPTETDRDLAASLGRTIGAVQQLRWQLRVLRPQGPKGSTADDLAPPLIRDIRVRAREQRVELRALARASGSKGAFKPPEQQCVPSTTSARAVELLGGELYAVWED